MIGWVSTNITTKSSPTESWVSANISTDCRKYVENTQSTENWPSIDQGLVAYWQTSGGLSPDMHVSWQQPIWADAPPTYRPSSGWYDDWVSTEYWLTVGRHSTDSLPIHRPSIDQYCHPRVGRQMPCIHMILLCFDRYRNLYDVNRVKDLEDLLKVFTIMLFKPASKFLASSADL